MIKLLLFAFFSFSIPAFASTGCGNALNQLTFKFPVPTIEVESFDINVKQVDFNQQKLEIDGVKINNLIANFIGERIVHIRELKDKTLSIVTTSRDTRYKIEKNKDGDLSLKRIDYYEYNRNAVAAKFSANEQYFFFISSITSNAPNPETNDQALRAIGYNKEDSFQMSGLVDVLYKDKENEILLDIKDIKDIHVANDGEVILYLYDGSAITAAKAEES